jgi:hypothetical protein
MRQLVQLMAFLTLFVFAGSVNALGPIKVDPDLDDFFSSIQLSEPKGLVVIGSVTLNRDQPTPAGVPVSIAPEFQDTQFGWVWKNNRKIPLLLKRTDAKGFARKSVAAGFAASGYLVVTADDPRSADAFLVDVEVLSLWATVEPIKPGALEHKFGFSFDTRILSDTEEFSMIGVVGAVGLRNAKTPSSPGTYRRLMQGTLQAYIDNFRRSVDASVITTVVTKAAAVKPVASSNMQKLEELHEAGILTEEEFARIKLRVLEE